MSSYDPELALVTKVLEEEDIKTIIRHKIGDDHFVDDEPREYMSWIKEHYDEHGRVPSSSLLREYFPEFEPEDTDDTLAEVVQVVKAKHLFSRIQRAVKRIANQTKEDPYSGLETLRDEAAELGMTFTEGVSEDVTRSARDVRRHYKLLKKNKGVLGLPWPWPKITRATRGLRRGTVNVLYGPEGSLKTWLLLHVGMHAHSTLGMKPLFFTYEMPVEDIRFRWAALRARVDYERFQNGALRPKEEKRFYRIMDELEEDPPFIVEELESTGREALTEIRAKTKDHDAKIVLLDGLAFVSEDYEWQSFGEATRSLKTIFRKMRVPLVVTHHANRAGRKVSKRNPDDGDTSDVALGITLARDADVMIRIVRTPQHEDNAEAMLITRKTREGRRVKVVINTRLAQSFDEKFTPDEEKKGGDDDILG